MVAPLVFAILALCCLVINLVIGTEGVPPALAAMTPWFGAALGAFLLLTVYAHYSVVTRVRLVARPELILEVGGKDIPVGRFERGWYASQIATGRGTVQGLVLELSILDESGRGRVLLREELGSIYSPPTGWTEGALQTTPDHVLYATFGRVHLDALAKTLAQREVPG